METVGQIKARIEQAVPNAKVTVENGALIVDRSCWIEVARYLRDDMALQLDFCSNLCAVDWLPRKEKIKVGDQEIEREAPGYLEVVYHLYSVARRHGPLTVKCRTGDRDQDTHIPSVTPIWRGAEYQEREAYDLYGIHFDGHPDLRRILMWEGFKDWPMRKDYKQPDDFEWEPTPHDWVVERVKEHQAKLAQSLPASVGRAEGPALSAAEGETKT